MATIHPICGEFRKHRWIMQQLKKALQDKDFSLLVIFPTLSLLHQIQDELLSEPEVCGLGGIRFLLFEGFIEEIGERFGITLPEPSPLVRDLLVTEVFESLKEQGKLSYLGKAPFTSGYRQAISAGIAEWKRSSLTTDIFAEWASSKGEKERQLVLLYQSYQHMLANKSYQEEDLILNRLEQLRNQSVLIPKRPSVILYGFTDLTPLQNNFMKVLKHWFEFEIIIDPTPVEEIRQFVSSRFACNVFPDAKMASDADDGKNILQKLQKNYGTEELSPSANAKGINANGIMANVRTYESNSISVEDLSVQILQTAGMTKQALAIAGEIRDILQKNPDYSLNDFLVLSPHPQDFIKAAWPIFNEYHLTLPPSSASVGEYPGPNHLSQLLTAGESDWQWSEMEVLIRQQYIGNMAEAGDKVLVELGDRYGALSGKRRWLKLLKNQDFHNYFLEKGLYLEPFQKAIVLLESIPEAAPLINYLQRAIDYLNDALQEATRVLVQSSITGEIDFEFQLGNIKAMQQLTQVIKEVRVYVDKEQFFKKDMTLSDFRSFWQSYIFTSEVKAKTPREAFVRVLVPQEARGLKTKILFITGLEQGVFPRIYIHDWKLSLKDRRELKAFGVDLETGENYQAKEKLAFYWALQVPEERLYLVYQNQDSSGEPLNPSPFLDEIESWFPELFQRAKRYPLALEPPPSLAECCSSFDEGSFLATRLMAVTTEIPELEREGCLELLQTSVHQQLAKQIWQEYELRKGIRHQLFQRCESLLLVEKMFGEKHTFAITALEDFKSCPYRFFLKQLLKVKPLLRPQMLPDNLDLGNLYHQVLQEFAEPFRNQSLDPEDRDEYLKHLRECFDDYYRDWQQNAANDLVKLVLDLLKAQIWGTLGRWLKSELDWAVESNGRFKIRYLELGFGLVQGDFDPASIPEPYELGSEGVPVKIWGKVDRVDADNEGNFMVYDYKSGRGPSSKDLLEVEYLQIPVYLLALEKLSFGTGKAVGGSYLGLKEPSRSRGGVWHGERLRINIKGQLGDQEWRDWLEAVNDSLISSVRSIRNGEFFATCGDCPTFCEYRSCCRRGEKEAEGSHETSVEQSAG